jgi:hypothetical protein
VQVCALGSAGGRGWGEQGCVHVYRPTFHGYLRGYV